VSGVMLVAAVVRWFEFVAFAVLAGAAALGVAVLPSGAPELEGIRRGLRRACSLAVIALFATGSAEFGLRAWTMAGGGVHTTLAAIPSVLVRTHFGKIWMLRAVALAILWWLVQSERQLAPWTSVVAIAAVALTTSLTGHAADRGDLSVAAMVDWVHVLASGVWTGGLLCLARTAPSDWQHTGRFGDVAHRFSRLAAICLLGLVASGSYNAWNGLGSVSALWSTGYGRLLALKLAFVAGMLGLGSENRWRLLPALRSEARGGLAARGFRAVRHWMGASPVAPEIRLRQLIAREAVLALVVFACTAFLVELVPPGHAPPHVHPANASGSATGRAGNPPARIPPVSPPRPSS
jgi:putative copper export protein